MDLPKIFEEVRSSPGGQLLHGGKTIVVFAVTESIDDGYDLAAMLSNQFDGLDGIKAAAMMQLSGGYTSGLQMGPKGRDVFSPFKLPETVMFVYPEHDLVPKEWRLFIDALCKHPEIKQAVIITCCPVILSDVTQDHVRTFEITENPYRKGQGIAGLPSRFSIE